MDKDSLSSCYLCNYSKTKVIFNNDMICIEKCKNCGLVFQNSYKQIDYLNYYKSRPTESTLKWDATKEKRLNRIIDEIINISPHSKVLDIGCGNGQLLDLLRQNGLVDCHGLESNIEQAKYCRQKGLNVLDKKLSSSLYPHESFDIITLIQVLEHIPEPIEFLAILNNFLKPGGKIIVEVPSYNNPRILLYRLLGIKNIVKKDFIIPHIYYYNDKSLKKIFSKSGFNVIKKSFGNYNDKFGPNFICKLIDIIANNFKIGGLLFIGEKR